MPEVSTLSEFLTVADFFAIPFGKRLPKAYPMPRLYGEDKFV